MLSSRDEELAEEFRKKTFLPSHISGVLNSVFHLQVAEGLANGFSAARIASITSRSTGVISNTALIIYEKLGINDRVREKVGGPGNKRIIFLRMVHGDIDEGTFASFAKRYRLSEEQKDVALYLLEGYTQPQINAKEEDVDPKSVASRIRCVKRKARVFSIEDLYFKALYPEKENSWDTKIKKTEELLLLDEFRKKSFLPSHITDKLHSVFHLQVAEGLATGLSTAKIGLITERNKARIEFATTALFKMFGINHRICQDQEGPRNKRILFLRAVYGDIDEATFAAFAEAYELSENARVTALYIMQGYEAKQIASKDVEDSLGKVFNQISYVRQKTQSPTVESIFLKALKCRPVEPA